LVRLGHRQPTNANKPIQFARAQFNRHHDPADLDALPVAPVAAAGAMAGGQASMPRRLRSESCSKTVWLPPFASVGEISEISENGIALNFSPSRALGFVIGRDIKHLVFLMRMYFH
jgi:hypothetical protein